MTPIRLADLRDAKVRRPDNRPEQLLLHFNDRAHAALDWGVRHALAPLDDGVAWELDSALSQLEQACALMRRELMARRFKEAA